VSNLLENFRIADFLDILVISVLLYYLLTWIRRRASRSVVVAIISVVALYTLARLSNMYLTSSIFSAGITAALVALVLIFQEDIRMSVEQIASWGTLRSKHSIVASSRTIDCLIESFTNMARDKIGALVVIKGRDSLDRHLSGGVSVNGRISTPLLYSIFHPATPSHDGAVIIEGDRIDKYGVRLPLSHDVAQVGNAGTRHTAALGLAERSDALLLVASEERGCISIAEQGKLERIGPEMLRVRLENYYRKVFPEPTKRRGNKWLTHNAGFKAASFMLAMLLWFIFAYRVETVNRTFTVPVEYRNIPSNWAAESPRPTQVSVSLSGLERAFNFDPSTLAASIDMSDVREGARTVTLKARNLNAPSGTAVVQITPNTVTVSARQHAPQMIPVVVKTTGILPGGMHLHEIRPQPAEISVLVPNRQRPKMTSISTEPLDLSRITGDCSVRLLLVVPENVRIVNGETAVKAVVSLRKKTKN
jgi:diadenylate cyclase